MRDIYIAQLAKVNKDLREMGNMVADAIDRAVRALLELDVDLAKEVMAGDTAIDHKEKEIESECLHLLLQQNPMASDLRQVSAALKMITDLERIGDHAADISEMVSFLAKAEKMPAIMKQLADMSNVTTSMVLGAVDAYINQDATAAKVVMCRDDEVDEAFLAIKKLIAGEIKKENANGEEILDYLMIAKYFERIGDHAENVGEWVLFAITGEHKNERVI